MLLNLSSWVNQDISMKFEKLLKDIEENPSNFFLLDKSNYTYCYEVIDNLPVERYQWKLSKQKVPELPIFKAWDEDHYFRIHHQPSKERIFVEPTE